MIHLGWQTTATEHGAAQIATVWSWTTHPRPCPRPGSFDSPSVVHREIQVHSRVAARLALRGKQAPVLLDDAVTDRQPQPRPLVVALRGVERVKHPLQRGGFDACPVVLNRRPHPGRSILLERSDSDRQDLVVVVSLISCVEGVPCIGNQVEDHLLNQLAVALGLPRRCIRSSSSDLSGCPPRCWTDT